MGPCKNGSLRPRRGPSRRCRFTSRPTTPPTRLRNGVRPARRIIYLERDFRKGDLSGRRPAGVRQPGARSAVCRRLPLPRCPAGADDLAALPRIAGHHRDSRRRRVEREDKLTVHRRRMERFLSQPFLVAEAFTASRRDHAAGRNDPQLKRRRRQGTTCPSVFMYVGGSNRPPSRRRKWKPRRKGDGRN